MTDAELIKSKIDIVSFISEYVQLKKAGRHFKANCPFHSEKTPSFTVSPERQSWHCFGACNTGGDVITFLEKWENIDFPDALKILAKRTGVALSSYVPTQESKQKDTLYEINHLASEYYHYLLTTHDIATRVREYLEKRGIKQEIWETFTLGYAPNSWDGVGKYLEKKRYKPETIAEAGLLVRSARGTYYDRFRGRLMFALHDPRGNVIGFAGRVLPPAPEKEAKYINSPETPIYIKGNTLYGLHVTKDAIRKAEEAIVVEGEIDLLTSFQAGVSNIVAIKGSALTEGHVTLLKRYTEKLVLSLDSDFAGNEAAKRGIEAADSAGLTVRVARLPAGKDPAECIAAGAHLWKKAVKEAIPIYDFVLETACEKYDAKDPAGKKKIGDNVVPFLARITNPIVQSHYIRKLAAVLSVSEESVGLAITGVRKKKEQAVVPQASIPVRPREERLEEHLLSLITQAAVPKKIYGRVFVTARPEDFAVQPIRRILEMLGNYFAAHEQLDIALFGKALPSELSSAFDSAFLADTGITGDDTKLEAEAIKTVYEIRKLSLRRKANQVSTNIGIAEREGRESDLEVLHNELKETVVAIKELEKKA